ncbi:hypothetical protein MAPG_00942, partial [Magnaporthiopsis poae ATCC 64411]
GHERETTRAPTGQAAAEAVGGQPHVEPRDGAADISKPLFGFPTVRAAYRGGGAAQTRNTGPRTPGVSVQTPATGRKTRDVFGAQSGAGGDKADEIGWDSDSDEDVYAGMSPPKTIQFAMPASRLLQTPAREASKRIVEDILLTAGAGPDESSEYSPTMVKMNQNVLDDSF